MRKIARFLREDAGAVTVDWVVLTAAVVGLAWVALRPIFSGTTDVASGTSSYVQSVKIGHSD